jgi:hypothetical protein
MHIVTAHEWIINGEYCPKYEKVYNLSLLSYISKGWDYVSELWPPKGLLFFPQISVWRTTVEWYWQGKTKINLREATPNTTLYTTNPTRTDPVTNTGLHAEKPAINSLNHEHGLENPWKRYIRTVLLAMKRPHYMTTVNLIEVLRIYH